ncbi:ATP-binding cassette domain-containing protein, partial [Campylobacter coli]|uniref:ATP-binding cassette domain-containing protein n=1 Tax=Campylobacter coli TaxID=195 RepID=UPI0038081772
MLEVKNLGKFYEFKKHWYLKKEKHLIFENINFSLKENENLMILGQSGAGKSTLARILCFLENPSFGEIIYKNLNPHSLDTVYYPHLRAHETPENIVCRMYLAQK